MPSKETISTIADRVMEGMAAWQNRPLDPVYPVIFIDCVNVKIRDGNGTGRADSGVQDCCFMAWIRLRGRMSTQRSLT